MTDAFESTALGREAGALQRNDVGGCAARYALGFAAAALAVVLRWVADPWLGGHQALITLYGAVAVAVWLAGAGPAVAAAVVGYFAADYLFIEPRGTVGLLGGRVWEVLTFVGYALSCGIIIAFGERLRRAQLRLHEQLSVAREYRRAQEALARAERRFRVAQDTSLAAFTVLRAVRDASGAIVDFEWLYANPAAGRILGHAPEALVGRRLLNLLPGNRDASGLFDAYVRVVETHIPHDIEIPYSAEGIDGWFHNVASPLEEGVAVWFTDISGRKRTERHLQLLVGELNHRVKNILAIVQSLTSQSLRGAASLESFRDRFAGRLAALAAAQDLLVSEDWMSVNLRQLVGRTLASQCPASRFEVSGPPVRLSGNAAVSLSMAVHELATNALKYGALSGSEGRLNVVWELQPPEDPQRLEIRWLERGGPPVESPRHEGFGSRLIRQLGRELGAEVELRFDPEGLECRLALPVSVLRPS